MSLESRKISTIGEMTNLMQVDSESFPELMWQSISLITALYAIIGSAVILWFYIGPAVFAGIGALVILIPINSFIATKLGQANRQKLEASDSRIKIINEVLNGIKVIYFAFLFLNLCIVI